MACNCGNTSICTQCSAGIPCNCPPDYSVAPQPVDCGCCPDGYRYVGITPNFPNGECQCKTAICTGAFSVSAIPCVPCEEAISSDCVMVEAIECLGITANTPLTTVLEFFCSAAYIQLILSKIGLTPSLGSGLCQLTRNCPPSGSTTPIPGPITITFP